MLVKLKKRVFVIVVALHYCTMPLVIKYASASLRSRMLYKISHEETGAEHIVESREDFL